MKAQEYIRICKVCKEVVASGFITCENPIEYVVCRKCEGRNDKKS
jgi:hypothetical protein